MKFAVLLFAGTVAAAAQTATLTKAQSDQFQKKLDAIVAYDGAAGEGTRKTTVTQTEVNAYLKYKGPELLPVGVTETSVVANGAGKVSGRAVVDLDAVRKKQGTGGWFDPRSYLTGLLPVTASGTLHTRNGIARFALEQAAVSGIPIPKTFLQELVSYYTRSTDYPNGVNIDDPFELPAHIKEIQIGQGSALVIQ